MAHRRIMVLGGYGRAGYCIAAMLLQATETPTVIIAGRRREAAKTAVRRLQGQGSFGNRVEALQVDAERPAQLRDAFASCDIVVIAMPYREGMARRVIEAALQAGVDYLDLNAGTSKYTILRAQTDRIQAKGCTFLTDGGIVPGCPSVLLRWAQRRFDRLSDVQIASVYRDSNMPRGSAIDIVAHAGKAPHAYGNGSWRTISPLNVKRIDFGPLGRRWSAPVEWPELVQLSDEVMPPRLVAYQGGMNGVVNALLLLWGLAGLGRLPRGQRLGVDLFQWANRMFTTSPYGIVLQLTATGLRDDTALTRTIRLYHPDVYRATAIPIVAALQQLMAGDLPAGTAFMGHVVQPDAFRHQIEQLGLTIDVVPS
jgi:saccharopine dehydrogenase (NAD+, L-lysine-forming)